MTVDSSKNHKKGTVSNISVNTCNSNYETHCMFFLHGHPINAYQDFVVKQVFAKEKLDTVWYENYF